MEFLIVEGIVVHELTLSAAPPFDFLSVVYSHGWYQLTPFRFNEEPVLETVVRLHSDVVTNIEMRPVDGGVKVRTGEDLSDSDQKNLQDQVSWMLDLEREFSAFYTLAEKEPKLAHVRKRAKGRLLRSPTLFEDLVKTILTTNTSWAGTKRMVSALVDLYGEPAGGTGSEQMKEGGVRKTFPTPQRLAKTSEKELREKARLGYRSPYIYQLAEKVDKGELDLEALKQNQLPVDELYKFLRAIKGVGGYAAAYLLLLLGMYDRIPVDSWAKKLVSVEWYDGEPVGEKHVLERFETWGEWKALAFWLWDWDYMHTLEN